MTGTTPPEPTRRRTRRRRSRISNVQAAAGAVVVIAIACYLVFGGSVPFSGSPFVLRAVFTANTNLHIPSPVRIAGVDVGEVTGVQHVPGSATSGIVTMDLDSNGLPVHADATADIRSRIFLEGNFYLDLHPGTPSAPILHSGATLPAASTSGPVQLDRILSSLTTPSRAALQTVLEGLGGSLNGAPTPADEAGQDAAVRGLTGGQALNYSLRYSAKAFEASAIVNQALLGEQPHDLSGVVAGEANVFRGLADSPAQLEGFVDTFTRTVAGLANRQQALEQTIGVLPALLRSIDAADSSLDASFAPTRAFATEILPGIRQLGPTIDAALPWLAQLTALASKPELGGLLKNLTPAVQQTAATIGPTRTLLAGAEDLARCFSHTIVPTGNEVIKDPPLGTGEALYQELYQSAVGLAGAAQNLDGNGRYLRSTAGGGAVQVQTKTLPVNGPLFGNAVLAPLGTRPAFPASAPPLRRDVPCFDNPAPNLNAAATGAGP